MPEKIRPFLKWAGNKYRIIDQIRRKLPQGKRLIEPFVGSAAVFLNTDYDRYLLTDSNADLIELYKLLKNEGKDFIEYSNSFFTDKNNSEERYYHFREVFNTTDDIHLKSALFIYMNRHGYNGLCRYNSKGIFNVPFGRYKKPYFPEKEMQFFHKKSRRAVFKTQNFDITMKSSRAGDVVYCDPPYVPLSLTSSFTAYATNPFGEKEQKVLTNVAEELSARDIKVLISNHHTPFTKKMYHMADITRFEVQRFISCKGRKRDRARELLALFA